MKIEPQRRHYGDAEVARLYELFGETPQWGDSLRPFLWTHVGAVVPGFDGATEVDLPIVCTYDFEVAAAKYLHALDDGVVPIVAPVLGHRLLPRRRRLRGRADLVAGRGVVPRCPSPRGGP